MASPKSTTKQGAGLETDLFDDHQLSDSSQMLLDRAAESNSSSAALNPESQNTPPSSEKPPRSSAMLVTISTLLLIAFAIVSFVFFDESSEYVSAYSGEHAAAIEGLSLTGPTIDNKAGVAIDSEISDITTKPNSSAPSVINKPASAIQKASTTAATNKQEVIKKDKSISAAIRSEQQLKSTAVTVKPTKQAESVKQSASPTVKTAKKVTTPAKAVQKLSQAGSTNKTAVQTSKIKKRVLQKFKQKTEVQTHNQVTINDSALDNLPESPTTLEEVSPVNHQGIHIKNLESKVDPPAVVKEVTDVKPQTVNSSALVKSVGSWFIELATLTSEKMALQQLARHQAMGINSTMAHIERDKRLLYAVRIIGFISKQEAEQTLQSISNRLDTRYAQIAK